MHSKVWKLLGEEKAKALVYIYTNSRLLCQRLCVDPVRYYDENIFSDDSNHNGGALLETNDKDNDVNDDNNSNGGKGHDGNNGDSLAGGGEHCRKEPPIILRNQHPKVVYDWNEINEGIANGIDKHTTVGSIENMHIDEDAPICFTEHAYDQANEEPNDDNATQERMASIGTLLVGLGRQSCRTLRRPPRHYGSTMKHSISGTSMNRNTNVGPVHGSCSPTIQQQSNKSFRGGNCPLDAREVRPFFTGPISGGSFRTPTSTTSCGSNVDEVNNISKKRRVKWFVKTKVGDNI